MKYLVPGMYISVFTAAYGVLVYQQYSADAAAAGHQPPITATTSVQKNLSDNISISPRLSSAPTQTKTRSAEIENNRNTVTVNKQADNYLASEQNYNNKYVY
jgi:hypothetical protein